LYYSKANGTTADNKDSVSILERAAVYGMPGNCERFDKGYSLLVFERI
jgi:hypothetical protein